MFSSIYILPSVEDRFFLAAIYVFLMASCDWPSVIGQRCELDDVSMKLNCSYRNMRTSVVLLNEDERKAISSVNFSTNNITEIEELHRYPNVQTLIFESNYIKDVKYDTFVNLSKLVKLDLSFNGIVHVDVFLLNENKHLKEVSLRGNPLELQDNKPLVCSSSMKKLDLSVCGLLSVSQENFMCLPSLSEINLSVNGLTTLSSNAFSLIPQLKTIELSSNRFYCDCHLVNLLKWLETKKSDLSTDPMCVIPNKGRSTLQKIKLQCNSEILKTETSERSTEALKLGQDSKMKQNESEEYDYILITYEMNVHPAPGQEHKSTRFMGVVSNNLFLVQTILPVALLILVVFAWLLIHRLHSSIKQMKDANSIYSYSSFTDKKLIPVYTGDHVYMQVK